MSEISKLKPESIWRNFYLLTQVPRPSGHLEKITAFLLDFAKQCGVEAFVDAAQNVVMRKPATPGMENRKGIILQAHMDMVPQKAPDSKHNFETDPIETWIDGTWVKTKGTTLGADNGLGVAAIMAVMEDKDLVHGPIEGLITADEETGMFGANDLPADELQGDILLNLDSETWGNFVIGSAGGIDITATREYKEVACEGDKVALKLTLQGLKGGHSGLEINEGRGNANKLMARIIKKAMMEHEANLVSWHGGNMRNAIPFKAQTVIVVPKAQVEATKEMAEALRKIFEFELKGIEDKVVLQVEEVEKPQNEVDKTQAWVLLSAILGCHNGVIRNIPSIPSTVETSSNLAIIDIEGGKAAIKILARSSSETMKAYICDTLEATLRLAEFYVEFSGSYMGWDPNTDSEVLKHVQEVYKELFNEDAIVEVCHAGLECSIILSKYPHLDVVSMGPTIRSPHTAGERADIPSTDAFWKLLKRLLEVAPEK